MEHNASFLLVIMPLRVGFAPDFEHLQMLCP